MTVPTMDARPLPDRGITAPRARRYSLVPPAAHGRRSCPASLRQEPMARRCTRWSSQPPPFGSSVTVLVTRVPCAYPSDSSIRVVQISGGVGAVWPPGARTPSDNLASNRPVMRLAVDAPPLVAAKGGTESARRRRTGAGPCTDTREVTDGAVRLEEMPGRARPGRADGQRQAHRSPTPPC